MMLQKTKNLAEEIDAKQYFLLLQMFDLKRRKECLITKVKTNIKSP